MKAAVLDSDDLRAIEEGFRAGAGKDELRMAEAVLNKLGYEKIYSKRRPGPKPLESSNPTDEEIRLRIEFLRMVLGEKAKELTRTEVLHVVLNLLRQYKESCSACLYLDQRAHAIFYRYCNKFGELKGRFPDFLDTPFGWPSNQDWRPLSLGVVIKIVKNLERRFRESRKSKWSDLVDEALIGLDDRIDEKTLFRMIQCQLGLRYEPAAGGGNYPGSVQKGADIVESNAIESEAKAEFKYQDLDQIMAGFFDQPVNRNESLRTAIASLYRIRFLIDSCKPVFLTEGSERLYRFVMGICFGPPDDRIPTLVTELHDVFSESLERVQKVRLAKNLQPPEDLTVQK